MKEPALKVRIFRECETQITTVEMNHEVSLNKLLYRRFNPRRVVELRCDLFSAASVGTVFVERRVIVGVTRDAWRTVTPVVNLDRGPCFPVTKIRPRPLAPATLPHVNRLEDLVVLRVVERVVHLVFKVIGNTLQVEAIFRKQKVVARRRSQLRDRLRLRLGIHRRTAIGARLRDGPRRLQVMNLANHFTLRLIILGSLARKPQQNVVQIINAVIRGPLHQLQIAHAGRVLAHELQNVSGKTLHARLNGKQPALAHLLQLRAREAGPDFVMNSYVRVARRELTEQLVDVLRSDDVVDRVEVEYAVTP